MDGGAFLVRVMEDPNRVSLERFYGRVYEQMIAMTFKSYFRYLSSFNSSILKIRTSLQTIPSR